MRTAVCVTIGLLVLAVCAGCSSTRRGFDYLFSSKYNERYGDFGDGADGQFALASFDDPAAGPTTGSTIANSRRRLARELYQRADERFRQAVEAKNAGRPSAELFVDAAADFERAAAKWPKSALQQDGLFMVGECYFFADRYPKANEAYDKLLKEYPASRHLDNIDKRRFSIAQYWLDLKPGSWYLINFTDKSQPSRATFGKAVKILDRIRFDNPTGKLADDATLAAGNAYFNRGDFDKADEFYEDLRKTFPTSEHQFLAHYFGVRTKLESYRGPAYDGDPLDEAEKLIKQIRKQFPRQAENEKYSQELVRASKLTRFLKAEREMQLARYYDGRGEYGGARFYYNILSDQYADTPYGRQAGERLAQISERPDKPPQRFDWLVKLFPASGDVQPLIATGNQDSTLR